MEFKLYEPHANQIKVHSSQAKNRVVVAGRRFGKSALALNEALARAFQVPNQIIWIILPLFRQAKEIYWIDPDITRYFMPYVQYGLIKRDMNELSLLVKKTNSYIRLKGSDNYDSLRGAGLDLVIWDEVGDTKPAAFSTIEPALADSPRHRQLYIGTPKGLNHFHDFALQGDHDNIIADYGKPIEKDPEWETWQFTSYDNMAWPEGTFERREFVKFLDKKKLQASQTGKLAWFNQEYMASFEESAGRFFPVWGYKTHVIPQSITPKADHVIYASMDWGRHAPFAWYAHAILHVNYEGLEFDRIVTFKEVYGTGKSPTGQTQEITRIFDYRRVYKTYNDPSMHAALSDGSMSIADQFKKAFKESYGESFTTIMVKASNNRVARWAAMDNWMRIAPDGLPYWMITTDCPNLIRTLPLQKPDPNKVDDLDTTLEDHAVDSVGYFLNHIKWTNAEVGGIVKPQLPKGVQSEFMHDLDIDAFATITKKRDWRSV